MRPQHFSQQGAQHFSSYDGIVCDYGARILVFRAIYRVLLGRGDLIPVRPCQNSWTWLHFFNVLGDIFIHRATFFIDWATLYLSGDT